MAQLNYQVNLDRAIAGQTYGARRTRPFTLAALPQITTVVIADATPAADEEWTFAGSDVTLGTGNFAQQLPSLTFDSGASLPATLDNFLAAITANGDYRSRFTVAEDGTDTLTITSRSRTQNYTFTTTPGGSATQTTTVTQASGGADVPLGTMVARSTGSNFRQLTSTDALTNLAGVLFRTDANNWRDYDEAATGVDRIRRGRTMSIAYDCFVWVQVEDDVTSITQGVHVRRGGTGTLGAFRGSADGGDTIDISTVAEWQDTAAAGLAPVHVRLF